MDDAIGEKLRLAFYTADAILVDGGTTIFIDRGVGKDIQEQRGIAEKTVKTRRVFCFFVRLF